MGFSGVGTALVLGGARSGKSTWAEAQFAETAEVEYVATSEVSGHDDEWAHRVALHRQRRPSSWRTTETLDLAAVLAADDPTPVLIDCIAVWFDRVLAEAGAWEGDTAADAGWRRRVGEEVAALVGAVQRTRRTVILVSNEVGLGVVPATAAGRLYRDELGRLNMRLAEAVGEVWFCVAGIAKRWR